MQTPTLCRTSPALETVQGTTNLFRLRAGHPALPHLIWIKWGKHHKLIPSQRHHPWGHFIHQTNTDWSKALTSKTTETQHPEVLLLHPSKWIALSTWLLLNSLCPFETKRCSEPRSQGKTEAERKAVHVTLCPRKHQYCFWAGTASFCSPEFREQTMAKDFTWHH